MRPRPHAGPIGEAVADLLLGAACVGCARPGSALCGHCRGTLRGCAAHRPPDPCPPGLAPAWSAGAYDGLLRDLVTAHKERGVLALARPLGELLAVAVAGALARPGPDGPCLLVPVPSRGAVVRSRGHDPLLRVARVAAGRLRAEGVDARVARLLRPQGRVRDQAALSATDRARNVAGTMRAVPRGPLATPGALLLVDDVLTTGATAGEAQRALEAVGLVPGAVVTVAATARRTPGGAEGGLSQPGGAD